MTAKSCWSSLEGASVPGEDIHSQCFLHSLLSSNKRYVFIHKRRWDKWLFLKFLQTRPGTLTSTMRTYDSAQTSFWYSFVWNHYFPWFCDFFFFSVVSGKFPYAGITGIWGEGRTDGQITYVLENRFESYKTIVTENQQDIPKHPNYPSCLPDHEVLPSVTIKPECLLSAYLKSIWNLGIIFLTSRSAGSSRGRWLV